MLSLDPGPAVRGTVRADTSFAQIPSVPPYAPRAEERTPVWMGDLHDVHFTGPALGGLCRAVRQPVFIVRAPSGARGVTLAGRLGVAAEARQGESVLPLAGLVPASYPEWLGDRSFAERHHTRFPYVVGEMAHGIASPRMAIAAGRAGMLGFIGTAGLAPGRIEEMVREVKGALEPQGLPWGANLIHHPAEPALERAIAEVYCRLGVPCVSASAFMSVTPAVVLLAAKGLTRNAQGRVCRPRAVFAKISRPETAAAFLAPPPADLLRALVDAGDLSESEAEIALGLPIAEDVTVEADSGGHTDNRPLAVALPRVIALRDELAAQYGYDRRIRVGAAGGLGTPVSVAAAFALGADYVLTGSVNQGAIESGLSDMARAMLAGADVADVAMAAAADMFELGVKVQVLKRGTMFASRANRLHDLNARYAGLDDLPDSVRQQLEKDIFRAPLDQIWRETEAFFAERNPAELARAKSDPKHQMALVFRWYLGNAIRWAIHGDAARKIDFQIWCGPAMGAFNAWSAGSFFDNPAERTVEQIGKNLLEGAAAILRAETLRASGVAIAPDCFQFTPRQLQ